MIAPISVDLISRYVLGNFEILPYSAVIEWGDRKHHADHEVLSQCTVGYSLVL